MGGISSRRKMTMLNNNNMSSNEIDDGNDNIDTNNNGMDKEPLQEGDNAADSFSSSTTTSSFLSRQDSSNNNNNNNNNIEQQPKKVNPYLEAIATPPPSDLISQFANTASSRAKNAARATIAGLMGGLTSNMMNGGGGQKDGYDDGFGTVGSGGVSSDASGVGGGGVMDARGNNPNNGGFTSKIVATGARLANLMFQLQMTGYMLRNAEYRLELGRSLGSPSSSSEKIRRMLPSQSTMVDDEERLRQQRGRIVKGTKIKVRYGDANAIAGEEEDVSNEDGEEESILSSPFMGLEVEVDAKAYVSELRGEIKRLRDAIESTRRAREEEVQEDLL